MVPVHTAVMESTERRFAHLLQPIRELTKNWDMDVAAELNDYLEELDEMCITLDEGKTQLNFAEAALLIQGSTCIYGKKVELLHSLVFQTLDYIRDRKRKRCQEAAAHDDERDAAAARRDDDYEEDFCELDIEAPDWVDRPEVGVPVKVAPLPPASLLPPESRDKHKFPLISAKGEVVCSQKDFRINIFLPGLQDLIYLTLPSASAAAAAAPLWWTRTASDLSPPHAPASGVVDSASGSHEMADGPEGSFLPADGAVEAQQDVDEHVERQQGPGERRRWRRVLPEDRAAPPACDTWALHDAYAFLEEKAFKSGKAHKVPAGLDEGGGKRKRQAAAPLQDFWTWFKQTYDPPERKLRRGPARIDLNHIYQSRLKSKLSNLKRSTGKEFGTHAADEDLMSRLLEVENAEAQGKQQDPGDGFEADEDEDHHEQQMFEAEGVDASPEVELSYKELVRLRVEQMARSCQDYAQQTALSRRVHEWEDQLRPKLLQQEARPALQIHEYADRIVSALGGAGRRRAFSSIVRGSDGSEACRFLLASLHLANEYTVAIDGAAGLEESVDSMALTLLGGDRLRPKAPCCDRGHGELRPAA
ncbi:condensin-2 complex subunit H2 [Hippocampus zosterae]|uniref:condensin-2 complex subunit H2 n=1 Tax=Hippocampus zosterae TaxID=109293 RepID=UPI00223D147C|nr:condensin-2 complex subunit H2 [Hippocampus zosterae]